MHWSILTLVDALLIGEAAEWAKENPLMQTSVGKQSPKDDDVESHITTFAFNVLRKYIYLTSMLSQKIYVNSQERPCQYTISG